MIQETEVSVRPVEAASSMLLKKHLAARLGVPHDAISHLEVLRRSVDARRHPVWIRMRVKVYTHGDLPIPWRSPFVFKNVASARRVVIAGTGPAGLFAALKLIEGGYKPVLIDRGKGLSERKRDIARIHREHKIHPDSNYCFGEGGAGTFSDGKLYTRATKRGDVQRILNMMVHHGASPEILVDAHPHIGSDKLLPMIAAIRETILNSGGEIHFGHRLSSIFHNGETITAFADQNNNRFEGAAFILAIGHSARDTYRYFQEQGWPLLAKPFALGVRIEHPQQLINSIQYHAKKPDPLLPAATYALTAQVSGKGVFSFCMCPGGIIVPSATLQNQIVVNGMSNSRRNSPFANAGIVTEISGEDLSRYAGNNPLAGLLLQEELEQRMVVGGEYSQKAPAQRVTDFLRKTYSATLPDTSYQPGVQSAPLHQLLPNSIVERLSEALGQFNRKMKGFVTDQAIITGVESRTSSPVRLPRCPEKLNYAPFRNLYPAGEGAGYAGGIVSSAIDGEKIAEQILKDC
jgi:uncharacterized protein